MRLDHVPLSSGLDRVSAKTDRDQIGQNSEHGAQPWCRTISPFVNMTSITTLTPGFRYLRLQQGDNMIPQGALSGPGQAVPFETLQSERRHTLRLR